MFKLPILNILDAIKDDERGTLLNKVIYYLYIDCNLDVEAVAIALSISRAIIYQRLDKDVREEVSNKKKVKADSLAKEIISRNAAGDHPKGIAYDMNISISKVYKVLKADKFTKFKTKGDIL